ncbi:eukaryotic translation initiation factor SUI1 [Piromyces finnis]|uniref:Eukaryotic translation initiation factor SUI1 n=1 Tax=Piromyces finnis TaxID=1754191 RepID=A0A1Y1V6Z0_9FUNG|nr:eukaryotic translation initiation factor SUI1 [Piromyces finnis]|eukprot:ORX48637.1 eukaryotic translation initiation factor SUI1 [Piromyces finnis]
MSDIQNFKSYDPFADTGEEETQAKSFDYILLTNINNQKDIRIQQRNGRKTLTTITGLPKEISQKKILKEFKKVFACNGTIVENEDYGEVIQLQGDHRLKVQQFLVDEKIATKSQVKIHGF